MHNVKDVCIEQPHICLVTLVVTWFKVLVLSSLNASFSQLCGDLHPPLLSSAEPSLGCVP